MHAAGDPEEECAAEFRPRPYLSVLFECCRVYQRVYLNAGGTAFVGWCPRCCARVEVKADPGGSEERFYIAR